MDEINEELFRRIRERCHQQHWYGSDIHNPFKPFKQMYEQRIEGREGYSSMTPDPPILRSKSAIFGYDKNRNQYEINKDIDLSNFPLSTDFEYSPATEEQLIVSEKALGYSLPAILRSLYSTVANGGFGPGYGLNGAIGGFQDGVDNNFHRDINPITTKNDPGEKEYARQLDLWIYGSQDYREIPFGMWPLKNLFTLCHWGCGICSYLDCLSGRIFRGEIGYDAYLLRSEATSLYEWLDLWIKGVDLWSRMYLEEKQEE